MTGPPATADSLDVLSRRAHLPDHVVHRVFAEETVVLNLRTGRYHGLNVTGGHMLEVACAAPTIAEAAKRLSEEYAQSVTVIEEDLSAFCRALAERDLLELRAPA